MNHPFTGTCSQNEAQGQQEHLTVLDLGLGMASALVAAMLAGMGATVYRIEPEEGDPFYDVYPAYRAWHRRSQLRSRPQFHALLASADICIVGGEDFPGVVTKFDLDSLKHQPALVVLDMSDKCPGSGPSVDLLAQARSGIVHGQFTDRPVHFAFPAPSYGAALQALLGLGIAMHERARSGRGQTVATSLDRAASMWYSQYWMEVRQPDAAFGRMTPKDVRALIMRGYDGRSVHFAMGVPGALAAVHRLLDIPGEVDPAERAIPGWGPGANFFGDAALYQKYAEKFSGAELLARFREAGLPVEPVLAPGECWDDEQVAVNELIVADGEGQRTVGMPLRFQEVDTSTKRGANRPVTGSGPLSDIRLVELASFVAGPYASRLLADFGADVIKVEPLTGDPSRGVFRTSYVTNRGKRSISVDAKSPEGAQILDRLYASADAVSHNLRPAAAKRLGIDFEALAAVHPGIVVLATTSYGETGPKAHMPGFDYIMQAYGGHELRAGGEGQPPMWYRSPVVDYAAGALGAIGLVEALRKRRGRSVKAQVDLLSTSVYLMSELLQKPDGKLCGAPLNDPEQLGFHPAERMYRCADGWIAVAARSGSMAQNLLDALAIDRGFAGPRSDWDEATARVIAQAFVSRTCDAALKLLTTAGVWAARCCEDGWAAVNAQSCPEDARVIELANARYGSVSTIAPHVRLSATGFDQKMRGTPQVGEHTREILIELSYSESAIEDLHERRIVRSPTPQVA